VDDKEHPNQVNAQVLNAILDTVKDRAIVASRDIYDERGTKLLAQHRPLTPLLHQRLLALQLKVPLEASLRFEEAPDKGQLRKAFASLMDSGHPLAQPLRVWERQVDIQITSLPLDPVAHFLMSMVEVTSPKAFEHAIQAMALAGAMSVRAGANPGDVRQAMLAGLLHDIGEIYLDPALIGDGDAMDLRQFRRLAAHPRRGEQLLVSLGQYPLALTRAVAEHHERLDGSGYPAGLAGDKVSPLGRMLCVVEATLGMLALPGQGLARASFALRSIPGEFDGRWMGLVTDAAADQWSGGQRVDDASIGQASAGLARASRRMQAAAGVAALLVDSPRPRVRAVALAAVHLLGRLRTGWNGMGLWGEVPADAQSQRELVMAEDELRYRLSRLERNCLWHVASLDADDMDALAPLWASLAD
jgi:HD-GYP domain-containing protein (c-di-GMP phosphodiesterase class II)